MMKEDKTMQEMLWHKHKWPEGVKKSLEPYPNKPLFEVLEDTVSKSGTLPYMKFMGTTTSFAETNDDSRLHRNINRLLSKSDCWSHRGGGAYLTLADYLHLCFVSVLELQQTSQ